MGPFDVAPLDVRFPARRSRELDRLEDAEMCQATLSLPVELVAGGDGAGGDDAPPSHVGRLRASFLLDHACALLEHRLLEVLRFDRSSTYSVSCDASFGTAPPLRTPETPLRGVVSVRWSCQQARAHACRDAVYAQLARLRAEGPFERELAAVTAAARTRRGEGRARAGACSPRLRDAALRGRRVGDVRADQSRVGRGVARLEDRPTARRCSSACSRRTRLRRRRSSARRRRQARRAARAHRGARRRGGRRGIVALVARRHRAAEHRGPPFRAEVLLPRCGVR